MPPILPQCIEQIENPVVIVTHAQHPLEFGRFPGREFSARLDMAAEVSRALHENGVLGSVIYTGGSRHRSSRQNDELSLAAAGATYLVDTAGVDETSIHGDDWNRLYLPQGVYNSGDEVTVAASGLRESAPALSGLIAVCAASQRQRLELHYDSHSLAPIYLSPEQSAEDYHGGLVERVLTTYTKYLNPSWQTGVVPKLIRRMRLPNDGGGAE